MRPASRLLGGLSLLLVIFGAGASFDSAANAWPQEKTPLHLLGLLQHRLPLADHLFESRPLFDAIVARHSQCQAIVTRLQSRPPNRSVEAMLAYLESESAEHPERQAQLAAVRYYLRDLLWECQNEWAKLTHGVTNYKTLLDYIERWRRRYEAVTLVTFNYDTLLEEALPLSARPIADIDDYIGRTPNYVTIKLHGSVNWARRIEQALPGAGLHLLPPEGEPMAWICSNISRLTFSSRIDILPRPYVRLPEDSKPGVIPVIAVPLQGKATFECPSTHVRVLETRLPETTKVLIIGWRAQDPALLELMAGLIHKPAVQGFIVAGTQQDAKGIRQTLMQHGVAAGSFGLADGGFSDLVTGPLLDEFLSM